MLNIAEGAGEYSEADNARFYRMARRSAVECAAVLDIADRLRLNETEPLSLARQHVVRIVSMRVSLIRSRRRSISGG